MEKLHVASIDYCSVFLPAFNSIEECREFYEKIKQTDISRYIFHQTARMIWLGDQIELQLAKGRPSLQILFYLIAAEAVAKIADNFKEEGQSRQYVKKFFENYCNTEDLEKIKNSITLGSEVIQGNKTGIDFLYEIRCDVVHKGKYYEIFFPETVKAPQLACIGGDLVNLNITINEIKLIILRAAKNACSEILKTEVCSI